ncbi:hypothetical protein [Clostridium sporogenes]|uniref:hypothetical protein n=1 Tax=Clostridium sporogenes TaxID=1509 RepID=UPI000725E5BE|nr:MULTISPECIES: hypothetical protein [Clostridium]MBY7013847.1 hypothetical protein [Clostridium sporogenes]MDS1005880.1 hypothetical protein [Clostridium sporogenes]MDU1322194.1 hypothetical protein [Clostridium botulinum]OQP94613.1 hypothetical protein VT96_0228340 [Clostridium sporogenes]SQB31350.1 Uncharacterised protein [Clostridium sporogenes]
MKLNQKAVNININEGPQYGWCSDCLGPCKASCTGRCTSDCLGPCKSDCLGSAR